MCNAVKDPIIDRLREHKQLLAGFKHLTDDFDPHECETRLAAIVVGRAESSCSKLYWSVALSKGKAVIL